MRWVSSVGGIAAAAAAIALAGPADAEGGTRPERFLHGSHWDTARGQARFRVGKMLMRSGKQAKMTATSTGGATIALSPGVIAERGDWGDLVTATWSGIERPSAQDAIALYCPFDPTADPSDILDSFPVTDCVGWASGACAAGRAFRIFDMRVPCSVAYLRAVNSTADGSDPLQVAKHELTAVSNPVVYANQGTPTQLRLMTLEDPASGRQVTRVAFTTAAVPGAHLGTVEVRVAGSGSSSQHASSTVSVSTTVSTYTAADLCSAPANQTTQQLFRDPGLMHVADLVWLTPGGRYEYRASTAAAATAAVMAADAKHADAGVGSLPPSFSSSSTTTTSWIPFRAPPPRDADTVAFAVIADHGTYGFPVYWQMPGANATLDRLASDVEQGRIDMVVHGGDLSYAVGNAYLWDQWATNIAPVASRVSWNPLFGNHEYDGPPSHGWHPSWGDFGDDSHGECGVPTMARFPCMPSIERPWRAIHWGPVLLVMMSTEHSWLPGSEQYVWVDELLAATDRTASPFVVIVGHRPMYSSQLGADPDHIVSLHFRDAMDALVNTRGVDLMLTGHYHSYERSCPVVGDLCIASGNATTHIVVGTAGAGLEEGAFPGKWSRFHAVKFGYGRLTATRDVLAWEFVSSETGEVLDAIKLPSRFS
jgi:hypothetical protein